MGSTLMDTIKSISGKAYDFVTNEDGLYIHAELTTNENCHQVCCVDGEIVGALVKQGSKTRPLALTKGNHRASVRTANGTGGNITWHVAKERTEATSDVVPGFEILTNALCPRNCLGCNQMQWMSSHALTDYQYKKSNAKKLVESLEEYDKECNLIFSGGEPRLWKHLDAVMDVFAKCKKIRSTRITTSQYDKEWITKCKQRFNHVGISIRNDHPEYLTNRPEWMQGCELWDERKHRVGLIEPCADIRCGCVTVGVTASICGDYVHTCTLSVDHSRGIQVEQYISGKDFHGDKIGVMQACLDCVNNTRAVCKTMADT